MSKLEKAIVAIVEVYEEFAGKDDDKKKISKAELKELFVSQLSSPDFKDKIDQDDMKEAIEKIDRNSDGQVNFQEFNQFVSLIARGYFRKKHGKKCGSGKASH